MKTLNAKRVAAIAAGAALLGVGLAFAGPVTFQNVPIISNSGQPVVQVVIGSTAKPADGVSAANIAAAIGNLAYTSVPVTATVNATQANRVLKVAVTSSTGTVANPQVWLNESSSVAPSGTYAFTALIGSVLNRAVLLGAPASTKGLQGSGQYSYPESNSLTSSPTVSPYSSITFIPFQTVSATTTGGGVAFTSGFRSGTYDNIMQVTNANLGALLQNSGTYGENEYLWLTGFPVFDQGTSSTPVNQFTIASAGGAYQVTFNKPIPIMTGSGSVNQPSITLLGKTWTILNYTVPGNTVGTMGPSGGVTSTTDTFGGSITLASSLVPLTTVYVGRNLTSGKFTVQLTDLGQPNSNGLVPAALAVYYNGALTNTSSIFPPGTAKFNVTGNLLFVKVNQTFAGLYQYQKWAKIQLFSNVQPFTSGNAWNATTNAGWQVLLGWTNSTAGTKVNALQTIIAYNITPVAALMTGQSFSFIGNPSAYKMTLAGDTLGNNFDALTATLSSTGSVNYQNAPGSTGATVKGLGNINNITEPAQYLTVTSQIPNAFSYSGQVGSSVIYDLVPYRLVEVANSMTANAALSANVYLYANTIAPFNALINGNNQLTFTVYGFSTNTATSQTSNSYTITSIATNTNAIGSNTFIASLYNITKVTVSEAIPGLSVVFTTNSMSNTVMTMNVMATFNAIPPQMLYIPSSAQPYTYANASVAASNVVYNQQNGQPTSTFTLSPATTGVTAVPYNAFSYNVVENPVPGQTTPTDALAFMLMNSTTGAVAAGSTLFQMNYSLSMTHGNVSYISNSLAAINVKAGFRTERGSKVSSISPTSIVLNIAKAVDMLSINVGPISSNVVSSSYRLYGPYGVGQPTNLANVSIGRVTANVTLGAGSVYTITGINNITATPSVSRATQPVLLSSLTTTPLVVLDSQASAGSNLILIGSGYVNTLSSQLQRAYNVTMAPTTQIDQAYGTNRILIAGYYANQTTSAANAFIQQLYANAASS